MTPHKFAARCLGHVVGAAAIPLVIVLLFATAALAMLAFVGDWLDTLEAIP